MNQVRPSFTLSAIALGVAGLLPFGAASAEEGTDQIENIVVVGQATNVLISAEELESYQADDLADVFRLTPSVNVGGSLGIAQKIYVRGLEDSYVNVTVDGAPQTSTLFHHIGRVTLDPALLKEVDVQAGAGEATSGAGAIGGAIRFKTKDVDDLLKDGKAFGATAKIGYARRSINPLEALNGDDENDTNTLSLSAYGKLNDNWGVLAYYNTIDRQNFLNGKGEEIIGTASNQDLTFVKVSGNITDNHYLSLSYEQRDEEADFSARPNWHVQEGDLLYASEATRETYVANYELAANDALNLEVSLYDTVSSFKGGRFDWYTEISTFGFDVRNTTKLGIHELTYGVDYRDDIVDSGDPLYAQEEGSVFGAYVQAHTQITEELLLSYGARYDDYSFEQLVVGEQTESGSEIDDSSVSFNAGFLYNVAESWTLGVGYAEAFRGKEVGDGFTIETPDYAGAPFAEDLEGESVSNVEASVAYNDGKLSAEFAVFQSVISDVIFDQLYGGPFYDNAGDVDTQGFELDLSYAIGDYQIFFGYSDVETTFDPIDGYYSQDFGTIHVSAYEFRHLGNSRGDTWTLGLEYNPTESISTGFNLSYVEDLTIDTLYQDFDAGWIDSLYELNKEDYTTVDVFAEWQASENVSLNLAIINLFDITYRDHSSVGDYSAVDGYGLVVGPDEAGRDVRLSVNFSF